ncbi:MAG: DUF898 family protein [Parvibaculaceae bacterium]
MAFRTFGAQGTGTVAPISIKYIDKPGLGRIALVNAALFVLTLTVYRFWAKTNVRRHIWSCVHINGEPLEYTGRGIDYDGSVHSLPRMLDMKAKEVRARLGEEENLPGVTAVRQTIGKRMTPAIRRHVTESRGAFRDRSAQLGRDKDARCQGFVVDVPNFWERPELSGYLRDVRKKPDWLTPGVRRAPRTPDEVEAELLQRPVKRRSAGDGFARGAGARSPQARLPARAESGSS